MPTAEIDVTPTLAHGLLTAQHPDLLAGRDLTVLANGWDNVILRLGDDLLVRLPRREMAAGLVEHEQRWLPRLADRLPVPVPAPVRLGVPAPGYPWHWSVVPWLPGRLLADVPVAERRGLAAELATFLAALHTPADDDVWSSPYRGGSLTDRTPAIEERIRQLGGRRAEDLLERFREVIEVPIPPSTRLWVHGDLHPLNVLAAHEPQDGGHLAAVVDWGDITAGDPACDLAIAWLGLDRDAAITLRTVYDAAATHALDPDALWTRAEAWAIHLSTMLLANSDDHPELGAIGAHGLGRLVGTGADPG